MNEIKDVTIIGITDHELMVAGILDSDSEYVTYEELLRRSEGLEPRYDYIKVDTRSFYEKYHFLINIVILSVILAVLDLFAL